jgi:NAD dependent epimerase/dehydratase family enzyme
MILKKIYLLSGGTGVVGNELAKGLAKSGDVTVVLTCRDQTRGEQLA